MAERPLLILPSPGAPVIRRRRYGRGGKSHFPSRERQDARLTPQFQLLQQALEAKRARFQPEAHGVVPEEVVVLETVGTVDQFIRAVERISGMEWLAEVATEDIPPDDDFFAFGKDGKARHDKNLSGRLFMVFTNQAALRQMLSLWRTWQAEERLDHGFGRWKTLFEQLREVRRWGVRDRLLETGVIEDWRERADQGDEVLPCEIELWYRKTPRQRRAARDRVADLVTSLSGAGIVAEAEIEEIGYHALMVHLPVAGVATVLDDINSDIALTRCEQVQFFRASGQMAGSSPGDEQEQDRQPVWSEEPTGTPVVALFDGLPLQAHRRLQGRLIIDDPDDFEQDYPVSTRCHGTAMASLIVHGDLGAAEEALPRPLYVRPILRPDPRDWREPKAERVPENTLVVDLLHRAVRRLFEAESGEPPIAPDIAVINLSIGILDRPFEQALSPLARLLDWLAWRYQILFIVSAGNHVTSFELSLTREVFRSLSSEAVQEHLIQAVAEGARHRRLLSPAEAVNVLTVAAVHDDASTGALPPRWIDPYGSRDLPSPVNAQGMGYRRAIKPDLLAPGGRVLVQERLATTARATLDIYQGSLAPGLTVAVPGRVLGDTGAVRYQRGTSNATAMVTRAAVLLHEVLDELCDDPGGNLIETIPRAVWLKALVAHAADWGKAGAILSEILRNAENSRQFKEYLSRLLGYGTIDIDRVKECTSRRATVLSGGLLNSNQSHVHRLPLPPSLSGRRGLRRLIITLAWLTPVNPRHQNWRRADLWFHPDSERPPGSSGPYTLLRLGRRQADSRAAQRGTLQHEILEGEQAGVFVDGDSVGVQVSCRADAGTLDEEVPYALAITLEVDEEVGVVIYEEIRERVRARIAISPSALASPGFID